MLNFENTFIFISPSPNFGGKISVLGMEYAQVLFKNLNASFHRSMEWSTEGPTSVVHVKPKQQRHLTI